MIVFVLVFVSRLLPVKFSDVLTGDWLTSFAKVFGDVTICFCVLIATSEDQEALVATSSCIVRGVRACGVRAWYSSTKRENSNHIPQVITNIVCSTHQNCYTLLT